MIAKLHPKFTLLTDPSHAWVKVKKSYLVDLIGDDWRKYFTSFSYERKDFVYLEEQKDTVTFMKECRKKDIHPEFVCAEHKTDRPSKIRGYDPLAPMDL